MVFWIWIVINIGLRFYGFLVVGGRVLDGEGFLIFWYDVVSVLMAMVCFF